MTNLTQQEEQAMIELAKAGDPEANYKMSLWALEQAMAEPEEERWNRLAAKCLVRAAEAGYPPAKERVGKLLQTPGGENAPQAPRPDELGWKPPTESRSSVMMDAVISFPDKVRRTFSRKDKTPAPERPTVEVRRVSAGKGKGGLFHFSQWDDAKWKKMQIVCIVICVILAVLIAIMLISGRQNRSGRQSAEATPIPTAEATATPEPALYPPADVRQEIASANLEVFPAEEDYVQAPAAAQVDTSGSVLRLRRGPGAGYGEITSMDNGVSIEIFAYKNGWALARYNGYIWGWCSSDYLKTG